jgi:rubrerythrin
MRMLEILTITENNAHYFDKAVNQALADGWELVRRECFITGSDRATTFYAELERIADEPEEEEDIPADFARWTISRDPQYPYRCNNCGYKARETWATCPDCNASMGTVEE